MSEGSQNVLIKFLTNYFDVFSSFKGLDIHVATITKRPNSFCSHNASKTKPSSQCSQWYSAFYIATSYLIQFEVNKIWFSLTHARTISCVLSWKIFALQRTWGLATWTVHCKCELHLQLPLTALRSQKFGRGRV